MLKGLFFNNFIDNHKLNLYSKNFAIAKNVSNELKYIK